MSDNVILLRTQVASPRGRRQLTRWQQEGFYVAQTVAFRWSERVPAQTRSSMIRAGWVIMVDGMPVLTPAGRNVCEAYQIARQRAIQASDRKVVQLVLPNRRTLAA